MPERIVVVGGGFAGLWAAAGAARMRALAGRTELDLDIVLVDPQPFHTIRVRCYEDDLAPVRVPLDDTLRPIGVRRIEARVTSIDAAGGTLALAGLAGGLDAIAFRRLVLAAGSAMTPPPVPIHAPTFDVDTYAGAARLEAHLAALAAGTPGEAARTVVVIGGGSVGIEVACGLPARLRALFPAGDPVRVVIVDRGEIGDCMGRGGPVVREALARLGIEAMSHTALACVDADGVALGDGTRIPAATVILATGMKASPLAATLGAACDRLGRVAVDAFLAVEGAPGVYAAGDCASAAADGAGHRTLMSCQHARPMGRLAGHNAACDAMGRPGDRIAFQAPDYVTVLDLGPQGALYTSGWDRGTVVATGAQAKTVKETINRVRIYPPRPPDREAIFAAAAPVIQAPPASRPAGA